MYFGWKLTNDAGKRMKRVGDTMTLEAGGEFDVVLADYETTRVNKSSASAGHPAGGLELKTDGTNPDNLWYRYSGPARDVVDLNFARSDGSVFRISKVTMTDGRLEKVPYEYGNTNTTSEWALLPPVDY